MKRQLIKHALWLDKQDQKQTKTILDQSGDSVSRLIRKAIREFINPKQGADQRQEIKQNGNSIT